MDFEGIRSIPKYRIPFAQERQLIDEWPQWIYDAIPMPINWKTKTVPSETASSSPKPEIHIDV
jgi:hypothetical protein